MKKRRKKNYFEACKDQTEDQTDRSVLVHQGVNLVAITSWPHSFCKVYVLQIQQRHIRPKKVLGDRCGASVQTFSNNCWLLFILNHIHINYALFHPYEKSNQKLFFFLNHSLLNMHKVPHWNFLLKLLICANYYAELIQTTTNLHTNSVIQT